MKEMLLQKLKEWVSRNLAVSGGAVAVIMDTLRDNTIPVSLRITGVICVAVVAAVYVVSSQLLKAKVEAPK